MRGRGTEERHHRVTDELLHRAAEALEFVAQAFVVRAKDCLHVLRVEPLRLRSEADEVGEEDGDDFALGARRRRRVDELRPAFRAELRVRLVLVATVGTDGHERSVIPRVRYGARPDRLLSGRR